MTKLCPYLGVTIVADAKYKAYYECFHHEVGTGDYPLCVLVIYDVAGSAWTRQEGAIEKFPEKCPLHFTYQEIKEKTKAFEEYIIKSFKER